MSKSIDLFQLLVDANVNKRRKVNAKTSSSIPVLEIEVDHETCERYGGDHIYEIILCLLQSLFA